MGIMILPYCLESNFAWVDETTEANSGCWQFANLGYKEFDYFLFEISSSTKSFHMQ